MTLKANIHRRSKRTTEAEKVLNLAKKYATEEEKVSLQGMLGDLLNDQGKSEESEIELLQAFNSAKELIQKSNDPNHWKCEVGRIGINLAKVQQALLKFQSASETIHDSLSN